MSNLSMKKFPGFPQILFLAVAGLLAIGAQVNGSPEKPELLFETVTQRKASTHVSALHMDSFGFLWVGSFSGLSRYNGTGFDIYKSKNDPNSLGDNRVRFIYEDRYQNLWIGGRNSLSRYRRETNDFVRYPLHHLSETVIYRTIETITEDHNGRLWASGGSHGLYYYDRESDAFKAYEPIISNDIRTIAATQDNHIWAATEYRGLQRINTKTGEITSWRHDPENPNSISSDITNYIVADHNGHLWLSIRNGGLNRIEPAGGDSIIVTRYINTPEQPDVLINNYIYTMHMDWEGKLWTGNENGGLQLYDAEQDLFHKYISDPDNPATLSHESISSIYFDQTGRLWVGTALAGLNVTDPYSFKFQHIHTGSRFEHRLNNNIIRSFHEDNNGDIWIATDGGGLNVMDRASGRFKAFTHDPDNPYSISSNAILSVLADPEGRIWTASYYGGVDLLANPETGRFISFEEYFGLPEKVTHISFDAHFDREHPYLWIAEFRSGLYRYDLESGRLDQFLPDPDDPHSTNSRHIIHLFEDSRNTLWISSLNGLATITSEDKQKGRFVNYQVDENNPNSIPDATIRQITEDPQGRIWITTANGLARYRPDTDDFQVYYDSDGLPANELQSILSDKNGKLWIGTINGLSSFHPEEKTFTNYSIQDGLQGHEFSRFAAYRLRNGELLFGGMNGFNRFQPDHIITNPHIPAVYLTDFRIFHESVRPGQPDAPMDKHVKFADEIRLAHWQNVITFEFLALNYTRPEHNQYAYMMEGFEHQWNYVGERREAVYTNLSPGTYRFRVIASNNDGIWNEEGTSIAVVIIPPFWRTPLFYLSAGVLMLLLVLLSFRQKIRNMKKLNVQLEQTVASRTRELRHSNKKLNQEIAEKNKIYSALAHDLRNPFTGISGYAEVLMEQLQEDGDTEKLKLAGIIHKASNSTYQLLENLLEWAGARDQLQKASMETLELQPVIDESIATSGVTANLKNITLQNRTEPGIRAQADRKMLQSILRNLLSNAIKYSNDHTRVTVHAEEKADHVLVTVKDQGIGIEPEKLDLLFSPTATEKRTGTHGEKGAGFGLLLCKDFVTQNGGTIWVESEPGKGSTFFFTLKKAQE